jgi:hypothetical protein
MTKMKKTRGFPELPEGNFEKMVVVEFHERGPDGYVNHFGLAPVIVNSHPVLRDGLEVIMNTEHMYLGWKSGAHLFPRTVSILESIFCRQAARAMGV